MNFSAIFDWINNHRGATFGIGVAIILIVFLSVWRFQAINTPPPEEELTEDQKIANIALSSEQQNVYEKYDNDTKKLIESLKNCHFISDDGLKNLSFNEKEIIERYNGDETRQTYAICDLEKTSKTENNNTSVVYDMVFLKADGKYYQASLYVNYKGSEYDGAITEMYFTTPSQLFTYANRYTRCQIFDNFTIQNWQQNANQFINNNYNGLVKCLQDYCYQYYPQANSAYCCPVIGINYDENCTSFNFTLSIGQSKAYILVKYYKDSDTFVAQKVNSPTALTATERSGTTAS